MRFSPIRSTALALLLVSAIFLQGCGSFDFAKGIQSALDASPPFIASLHLGPKQQAVTDDFTELGRGAATFVQAVNQCAGDKSCDLKALSAFSLSFNEVIGHGNFGIHPALTRIQQIVDGLIASARIYYGATASPQKGARKASVDARTPEQAKKDMEQGLKDLKAAMEPVK